MNKEKEFFKVTITKADGTVVKEIETDCIMAAIKDVKEDAVAGVFITNCDALTMCDTYRGIDKVKRVAMKENPMLSALLLASTLEALGGIKNVFDKEDENKGGGKNAT